MQDAKRTALNDGATRKQTVEVGQSDATSKKTLQDLDKTDLKTDRQSDETSIPSPDGSPNSEPGEGRADGSDTGGPM